jgi:hypothetical protein
LVGEGDVEHGFGGSVGAGLRPAAWPPLLTQRRVHALPGPIAAPGAKLLMHTSPGRKVYRQRRAISYVDFGNVPREDRSRTAGLERVLPADRQRDRPLQQPCSSRRSTSTRWQSPTSMRFGYSRAAVLCTPRSNPRRSPTESSLPGTIIGASFQRPAKPGLIISRLFSIYSTSILIDANFSF